MSEQKVQLNIRDVMRQLEIDENKWRLYNQPHKVTVKRHSLIGTTKRTVKLYRRIII